MVNSFNLFLIYDKGLGQENSVQVLREEGGRCGLVLRAAHARLRGDGLEGDQERGGHVQGLVELAAEESDGLSDPGL